MSDIALNYAIRKVTRSYLESPASLTVRIADLPALIRMVAKGFKPAVVEPVILPSQPPAVSISRSIHHDYLVCIEDGKKMKMLTRHLRNSYGMSPDDYRRKWGLPPDYPMVSQATVDRRSAISKWSPSQN